MYATLRCHPCKFLMGNRTYKTYRTYTLRLRRSGVGPPDRFTAGAGGDVEGLDHRSSERGQNFLHLLNRHGLDLFDQCVPHILIFGFVFQQRQSVEIFG